MKKLLIVLVLVVALAVGGGAILLSSVNSLLVKAVNTYGPDLVRTSVHLDEADISFWDGKGTLKGFSIGNPDGFRGEYSFRVNTIHAALDVGSLKDDVVVIDQIDVVAPDILYERTLNSDNLQTLVRNIRQATGTEKKSAGSRTTEEAKESRVLIRELIIRNGKVSLLLPGMNDPVGITLPDIRLYDIGKESGSAAFSEVAVLILQSVSDAVLSSSRNAVGGAENILRDAGTNIGSQLDTAGDKLNRVTNRLNNIFGK